MKHFPALAHGSLTPVFDDIWFVKGAVKMPMRIPMKVSRTMTVVRIKGTRELAIVNSMRLSDEGLHELDALGKVAHVIRIGGFHGRDDGFYREKYGAKLYALEGQSYARGLDAGEASKAKASYLEPDVRLNKDSALPITGASLQVISSVPPEGVLRLPHEGGVLVTGDSLQNTPSPDEYVNFPAKLMMRKMGFYKPFAVGPAWLQFAKPSAAEVRAIADVDFNHVLPGHGDPVIGGAKEKYLPNINGNLKGCHD